MKKLSLLFLWGVALPAWARVPAKFSLDGYDPKSCTFISQDRLHALALTPVVERNQYGDPRATGELETSFFWPRSYRSGTPSGLDLYENPPFRKKRIKAVTSYSTDYSTDRGSAPMCVIYEGGEGFCNGFQAHSYPYPGDKQWRIANCDVFFLREASQVPKTHEWVSRHHCTIHVPLEKSESIEKMLISDQIENWHSEYHDRPWRGSAASLKNVCFLNNQGEIKCFGSGFWGLNGKGDTESLYPTFPEKPSWPVTLQAHRVDLGTHQGAPVKATEACLYNNYACAVLETGRVKCWGAAELPLTRTAIINDQLYPRIGAGPGQMGDALAALELGNAKAKKMDCSYTHMCVLFEDGTTRCLGSNQYGQLGHSIAVERARFDQPGSYPIAEIPGESETVDVFTHAGSTCAVLSSGHLSCFGLNTGGILGAAPDPAQGFFTVLRLDDKNRFPIVPIEKSGGIVGMCMDPLFDPWPKNEKDRKGCALYGDGTLKCWQVGWSQRKKALSESVLTVLEEILP